VSQDYIGLQRNNAHADVKEAITQLGLEYRLMTQFTSFVAVEEMPVTDGGEPRRVIVPVAIPDGMNYQMVTVESSSVGVTISEHRLENLPLNGRSFADLAQLT